MKLVFPLFYLVRIIAQSLEKGKSPNKGTEIAPENVKSILAKFSEKDFDELMKEVTSPNGTTEAGLKTMSEKNLGNAIILGIKSAYKRARELNND